MELALAVTPPPEHPDNMTVLDMSVWQAGVAGVPWGKFKELELPLRWASMASEGSFSPQTTTLITGGKVFKMRRQLGLEPRCHSACLRLGGAPDPVPSTISQEWRQIRS